MLAVLGDAEQIVVMKARNDCEIVFGLVSNEWLVAGVQYEWLNVFRALLEEPSLDRK